MKRIKAINGYTIYQATTQRDADNYRCQIGDYSIYLSSDIRDFGLSCSYPEWDGVDSLAVAVAMCNGSKHAVAVELAEELSDSTVQDMDLVLEIERRLDAGESLESVRDSYDTDEQCFTRDCFVDPFIPYEDHPSIGQCGSVIPDTCPIDEDPDLGDELSDCPEQEPAAVSDEDATGVYLRDLYEIAPQAHIFIVTRADVYDLRVTSRREYTGGKADGDKFVWRVTPASYPMHKNVLEVEII